MIWELWGPCPGFIRRARELAMGRKPFVEDFMTPTLLHRQRQMTFGSASDAFSKIAQVWYRLRS